MRVFTALLLLIACTTLLEAASDESGRSSKSVSYISGAERPEFTAIEPEFMSPLLTAGERSNTNAKVQARAATRCGCDISLFDVRTFLLEDADGDGYYHRFKVVIDADSRPYRGRYVYARLFASYEGGPWNEYASSADFYVEGNTTDDEFVVETELVDGYPAGYYDLRVELYDADTGAWILESGPYEDDSLALVPLEDRDRDYYVTVSAGSFSGGLFSLLLVALWRRYRSGSATGNPASRQAR